MEKITFKKPVIDLNATGESIKKLRKSNGLSIRDIQNLFGFEYPQAVYSWEQGKNIPSIDNLLILARLFKVSLEDLIKTSEIEVEVECSPVMAEKICNRNCEICRYKLSA